MKARILLQLFAAMLAPAAAAETGATGAQACPVDAAAALLARHEQAREAHLEANADLLEAGADEKVAMAGRGNLDIVTKESIGAFLRKYLAEVRYLEWSDMQPPVVTVSPDGQLGWMAVQVKARYVERAKPEAGEKSFKSSWVATYRRAGCDWKMTGMSSAVVDL